MFIQKEIETKAGETLCRLFEYDPDIDIDSILSKSKRDYDYIASKYAKSASKIDESSYKSFNDKKKDNDYHQRLAKTIEIIIIIYFFNYKDFNFFTIY